jgi:hypothetical protein
LKLSRSQKYEDLPTIESKEVKGIIEPKTPYIAPVLARKKR